MDPHQQKASSALEPFIILSKSATSPRAAADLIERATSSPNTFIFAELLETPNIQNLASGPPADAAYFTLLQIFAWGTWKDYECRVPSWLSFFATDYISKEASLTLSRVLAQSLHLPELSDVQRTKLRQLSLLTFASRPHKLTYSYLLDALSLNSVIALESLVTSSIYAGLLEGQLNPLFKRLDISSVAPLRDLRPGCTPFMIEILQDWDKRCVDVMDELQLQIYEVRQGASERKRGDDAFERQRTNLTDEAKTAASGKRSVEGADEMDLGDGTKRTRAGKSESGMFGAIGRRFGGAG